MIAAGKGAPLRPLTEDKPMAMVDSAGKLILTHCFETLVDLGTDELIVVGRKTEEIVSHYVATFRGVAIGAGGGREAQACGVSHGPGRE